MKLFDRVVAGVTERAIGAMLRVNGLRGGWWPWVREPTTGAWQRDITWTTDIVLAHHAVYACITRIAQDVAKLRPKLMEQDSDGIWTEIRSSAFSPALRNPNHYQNYIQFRESWIISKLTWGNTYVLIARDRRGVPIAFYVLDPSRVKPLVATDGSVFYDLAADNLSGLQLEQLAVPAADIIHDRMNCLFHPLCGTSPIFASGQAANMGLQIERNSSRFFGNDNNPAGILTHPGAIDAKKSKELADIWEERYGPGKPGGIAVLGAGMAFTQMRMNAVDAQTIEQLRWTAETVCSTFHVPPWKIGIGQQPAYTKPEIANQAYYSDCLQYHVETWESCMDEAFRFDTPTGTPARMLGVELDLEGLLRMDAASQLDTLGKAIGASVYTVNEARKKADLPPVDGGNSIWMQQQNFSLEALAERDRNDPFSKPEPLPGPAGAPGRDGQDGQPGAQGPQGERGADGQLQLGLADWHQGTYDIGRTYERNMITSWDGCSWVAMRTTAATPGDGDDWRLISKRGRDGRDRTK